MEERNTTGEYLNLDRTVTSWVTVSTPQNGIDWVIFLQEIQKTYTIIKILEYIVTLVGLAGNAVVFRLLSFHIKRNAFSVYILNLAAADFVFLFIWMTLSIRSLSTELELYNEHTLLFLNLNIFPYIASLSIITAISIERCMSVLQPIWYYSHRPKYLSAVVCALLWALSLLLSILSLEFSGFLSGKRDEYLSELTDLSIATWLIFSFVLLFVSSLVLLTRLLCGSRKRKPTRLYVIIGLTVLVFLICGLPWGICWFLLNWMPIWNNIHIFRFHLVTEVLSCVNSCANPIIYFFVGSYRKQKIQHRRSIKVILQRALQDIPVENGSDGHSPQETLEMSGRSNDSHLRVML